MKPKKIVRIIARLNIGGPSIHTVLLSSELTKRGHRDLLVCGKVSDSEGDMIYLAKDKNITPLIISDMARDISPLKDLKAFFALLGILRRERPDIVHTHTAKAGTLGRLAAICAGVPIRVHTFHGHVFDGYFNPVKARIFLTIERTLALFTDRVITVSECVRKEIVDKLKIVRSDKCVVVPLGFELDRFLTCEKLRGGFRQELGIGPDVLLIGIVGRLVPIKNHVMFLDAASKIVSKDIPEKVKFVIIGDGECAGHLKDYARRLRLQDDILFTGWRHDLAPVYADLDIVALTSLNEGTPVSIIEAMASGRSVVATDVGGVRDLVASGENGYLVRSNDVDGFAGKLIDLIRNADTRARFGARGRLSVKDRYSKERLVNDIESLYEECLRQKRLSA